MSRVVAACVVSCVYVLRVGIIKIIIFFYINNIHIFKEKKNENTLQFIRKLMYACIFILIA